MPVPATLITCGALLLGAATAGQAGSRYASAVAADAPPADEAAWLYQPDHVTTIDLKLSSGSRARLAAEPDEYVRATFSLSRQDGATYGPLVVGVKLKGHASFRSLDRKSAFKIKFGEFVDDQRFLGLKTMVLNNMVQDPTMLHEVLAYEAFRAAGLPAWRTGYSFLRINGQAYGVYLNLESPDDVSVARWYPSTRHLYEGGQGIDLVPGDAAKFEVEEGDEENLKDLDALIAAAKDWKTIDAVADLDQMTRFWAVEKYIGHWDGYSGRSRPNNYYLHSDGGGRFTMLPWGTDQTWERRLGYGDRGGAIFNRCLAHAACDARYRGAVDQVRSTLGALDLPGLATRTAALLYPWQRRDPRRESTMKETREGIAALQQILVARRADTMWRSATPARVTLHARAQTGGRVRFFGSVTPRHDGRTIQLQRRIRDRFRTIASAKLTKASVSRSQFAITLRNRRAGHYRAYLPADDEHLASTAYLPFGLR